MTEETTTGALPPTIAVIETKRSKVTVKDIEKSEKEGGDVNEVDSDGHFPLEYAAKHDCVSILEYLHKHRKVDVRKVDQNMNTALHIAASNGRVKAIKALVAYGSDVDAVNQWGLSPLMYTCKFRGNAECIQALIRHGCKVDMRDEQGYTALDMARQTGKSSECIKLLENPDRLKSASVFSFGKTRSNDDVAQLLKNTSIPHATRSKYIQILVRQGYTTMATCRQSLTSQSLRESGITDETHVSEILSVLNGENGTVYGEAENPLFQQESS